MNRAKYLDSTGSEVSASQALDHDGVLRNSYRMVVPTMFRDSTRGARITDGRTSDPLALHRPGFRVAASDSRLACRDARAEYQTRLINAYKIGDGVQCSECFGSGESVDGEDCPFCDGTGVMPERERSTGKGFGSKNEGGYKGTSSDSRTTTTDQEYQKYDAALAQAYRNNG
jgi:hypothetical protein